MVTEKPTLLGYEADGHTGSEFRNLNHVLNPDLTSQFGSEKGKFPVGRHKHGNLSRDMFTAALAMEGRVG